MSYYTYNDSDILEFVEGFSIGTAIITLALCVLVVVSLWKIFKKAGKNGWEAIVPIYNIIVLLEICEIPVAQIILFFIPIANIYIMFKIYIELAKKFGKGAGIGVLTAFFPYIGLPIIAFSDTKYQNGSSSDESQASILDVNEVGVPNNSEASDFSYGYEKEETVVMQPVSENVEEPESVEEKSEIKEENSETVEEKSEE